MSNLKIQNLKTDSLIPYARNAKKHDDAQVALIAGSIREFGFNVPVAVRGEPPTIVAGHGRVLAARKLGMAEVPCVRLDHLTDVQMRAYILADNKLAEKGGGWDEEMLRLEVEELAELDVDLGEIGISDEELAELTNEQNEGLTDADETPEPSAQPISVLGDVWVMGKHRVMCGSSTEVTTVEKLMAGEKADMVFTDPPYGIKVQMNNPGTTCKDTIMGDTTTDAAAYCFKICQAMNVPLFFWGANHYAFDANLPNSSCWVVWDKQGGKHVDHADCELAWTNIKSPARVFKHIWDGFRRDSEKGEKRVHPTQKPVALIEEIFEFFNFGKLIFDFFGGSGSTLIACEKTGRQARLMELDPKYVDVIVTRWQEFTGKQAVNEATGLTFEATKAKMLGK